jgi:hypothetical protein
MTQCYQDPLDNFSLTGCSYSLWLSFSPVKAGGNDVDFQVGRVNSGVWN